MAGSNRVRGALWFIALIVAIAAIVVVNTNFWSADRWRAGEFLATLGLLVAAMCAIGCGLNGRLMGLIIDNRNRASLSKLQMLAWTVLVISALTALAASRLRAGAADALNIAIPSELLAAMGIASASFVATPAILSLKAGETASKTNLDNAAQTAQDANSSFQPTGKVYGRTDPADASWTDLFRGDEVGSANSPDLSKIQQFAITLLLLGIYTATLFHGFVFASNFKPSAFTGKSEVFPNSLPVLSQQFVILMAISHASYLVYKAAPHTSTGNGANSASATAGSGNGDGAAG